MNCHRALLHERVLHRVRHDHIAGENAEKLLHRGRRVDVVLDEENAANGVVPGLRRRAGRTRRLSFRRHGRELDPERGAFAASGAVGRQLQWC